MCEDKNVQEIALVKMLLEAQKTQAKWIGISLLFFTVLVCSTTAYSTMYIANRSAEQSDKIFTALFDAGVEDEIEQSQ